MAGISELQVAFPVVVANDLQGWKPVAPLCLQRRTIIVSGHGPNEGSFILQLKRGKNLQDPPRRMEARCWLADLHQMKFGILS